MSILRTVFTTLPSAAALDELQGRVKGEDASQLPSCTPGDDAPPAQDDAWAHLSKQALAGRVHTHTRALVQALRDFDIDLELGALFASNGTSVPATASFRELLLHGITSAVAERARGSSQDDSVSTLRTVTDLLSATEEMDTFLALVRSRFTSESHQAMAVNARLADIQDSYRATLLHTLRLATQSAARLDEAQRQKHVWRDIDAALEGEVSGGSRARASASAAASSHAPRDATLPNPFDWQRTHAHAIASRLVTVHVQEREMARKHRLHSRASQRAVVVETKIHTTSGTFTRELRVEPLIDTESARASAADAVLAVRATALPAACAERGIPYELEVVRVPVLACVDASAAASNTFNAVDAAAAVINGRRSLASAADLIPLLPPTLLAQRTSAGAASAVGRGCALQRPDATLPVELVAGGTVGIPAPSSIPTEPRAHSATLHSIFADYAAHSDCILSPYFADTCGMHEASDMAPVVGIVGPTMSFVFEACPGAVPLSQLLRMCGAMSEGQLLFRHIAGELLRACADIEAQCTFDVPPGALTVDNVYLTDCGTRVILRGVQWGAPLFPTDPGLDAKLRRRSRVLLRSFATIVRQLLEAQSEAVVAAAANAGMEAAGAEAVLTSGASSRHASIFSLAHAQLGLQCRIAQTVVVTLQSQQLASGSAASSKRSTPSGSPSDSPKTALVQFEDGARGVQVTALQLAEAAHARAVHIPAEPDFRIALELVDARTLDGVPVPLDFGEPLVSIIPSSRASAAYPVLAPAFARSVAIAFTPVRAGTVTLRLRVDTRDGTAVPDAVDVVGDHEVPITIFPQGISPVLTAILDVCYPSATAHPAFVTLLSLADVASVEHWCGEADAAERSLSLPSYTVQFAGVVHALVQALGLTISSPHVQSSGGSTARAATRSASLHTWSADDDELHDAADRDGGGACASDNARMEDAQLSSMLAPSLPILLDELQVLMELLFPGSATSETAAQQRVWGTLGAAGIEPEVLSESLISTTQLQMNASIHSGTATNGAASSQLIIRQLRSVDELLAHPYWRAADVSGVTADNAPAFSEWYERVQREYTQYAYPLTNRLAQPMER